jgi:hypothetical protein
LALTNSAVSYNDQPHWAHRERQDGRRAPAEVLGFVSGVRHREEELRRAFFSARFVRVLDALGYVRFMHWRLYGEEALAGSEAALWLAAESPSRSSMRARRLPATMWTSRPTPADCGRWSA